MTKEEEQKNRQRKEKKRERERETNVIHHVIIIMPVPRGSLFGVPNELYRCERPEQKTHPMGRRKFTRKRTNESAKDIIDEPDTPWASPPPELFDSDAEEDEVLEEDVANKRKMYAEEEIKERLERLELNTTRQSTGVEFVLKRSSRNE